MGSQPGPIERSSLFGGPSIQSSRQTSSLTAQSNRTIRVPSLFGGRRSNRASNSNSPVADEPGSSTALAGGHAQTVSSSGTPDFTPRPGSLFEVTFRGTNQVRIEGNGLGRSTIDSSTPVSQSSQSHGFCISTAPTSPSPAPRSSQQLASNSGSTAFPTNPTPTRQLRPIVKPKINLRPPKSFIDPNGDLCLEVGPSLKEFVVCSRAMTRSSSFWKTMLHGDFAEGKKAQSQDATSEWVVKLPEDNPTAMEIILNIVHCRFSSVSNPEGFVYTTHLYNLCVLTDKYDMTHILRPWAKGWSSSTHAQCDKIGSSLRSKFCHERLWISWELGDQPAFEDIAKAMFLHCSPTSGNHLRYIGALEPPGIFDKIEEARLIVIKAILEPLNEVIQEFIRGGKCKEMGGFGGECCIPLMLGTAIQSLNRLGLWPIPDPIMMKYSVSELAEKVQLIELGDPKAGHVHLCPIIRRRNLKAKFEAATASIPPLLTDAHRRHLDVQAKKSGFGPPENPQDVKP